jgi:hypothetical protein
LELPPATRLTDGGVEDTSYGVRGCACPQRHRLHDVAVTPKDNAVHVDVTGDSDTCLKLAGLGQVHLGNVAVAASQHGVYSACVDAR